MKLVARTSARSPLLRISLLSCAALFCALLGRGHAESTSKPCSDDEDMYHCRHNNRCIPKSWVCDFDDDCGDGADESNCDTSSCDEDEFACEVDGAVQKCIPHRWKCDGDADCADAADEKSCDGVTCSGGQFACEAVPPHNIRICIPASWKCDGQADCQGGGDELDCAAPPTATNATAVSPANRSCGDDEMKCDNGRCVFDRWRCDHDDDCGDGTDERDCPSGCKANHFSCFANGYCVPLIWKCDGEGDCIDDSDEVNCTHATPPAHQRVCENFEFRCAVGDHCINRLWVCDGDDDCPDHSDEKDCEAKRVTCADDQFPCASHTQCVSAKQQCDGSFDCGDGSDETNCTSPTTTTTLAPCSHTDQFACGDGTCVDKEHLCDGVDDCKTKAADGAAADEAHELCSRRNCHSDNGGCEQQCVSAGIFGGFCTCTSGYRLVDDSKCEDVDECATPGTCSQLCHNVPGSFRCSCYKGYLLQRDRKACRARGDDPKLLLSNRMNIRQIDLTNQDYMPLISELHSAVALDFIYARNTLIWSDVAKEEIMICNLGSRTYINTTRQCEDNVTLVTRVSTPDGLAVDWVHDLLYWTDTGFDTISVISVGVGRPRYRKTLFETDLDEPRAIAVDPKHGLLFWTDWGRQPKIERSTMDGEQRMVIVDKSVKWPNGLAIDILAERIYWADAKLKLIMSANYDGTDKRLILNSWSVLKHPFSLSVFEEKLYWTDWDTEGVHSADKFTGADQQLVVKGLYGPMTVKVYHPLTQPSLPNKCLNHNCAHLCLPSIHVRHDADARVTRDAPYTCHCADGFRRDQPFGKHCLPTDGQKSVQSGRSSAFTFLMLIAVGLLVVGTVLLIYRRRLREAGRTLNFDNPVYRRTVDDGHFDAPDGAFSGGGGGGGSGGYSHLKLRLDPDQNPSRPAAADNAFVDGSAIYQPSEPVNVSAKQPLTQDVA